MKSILLFLQINRNIYSKHKFRHWIQRVEETA